MEKSDEAFLTIGEMSKRLSVKPHILRYWEEQFPMLNPLKRAGGRRHYRPIDASMLVTIHRLLNKEGYTIKGACKYLNEAKHASVPSSSLADPVAVTSTPSIAALISIRDRLSRALAAA